MDLQQREDQSFGDALARLRLEGGPVAVTQGGDTVAVLLTPAELERLEDERDSAMIRAALAENGDEPTISLEDFAAELGIALRD